MVMLLGFDFLLVSFYLSHFYLPIVHNHLFNNLFQNTNSTVHYRDSLKLGLREYSSWMKDVLFYIVLDI